MLIPTDMTDEERELIEKRLRPEDEDPNDNLNGQLDWAKEVRAPYTTAEIEQLCQWKRKGGAGSEEESRLLATVVAFEARLAALERDYAQLAWEWHEAEGGAVEIRDPNVRARYEELQRLDWEARSRPTPGPGHRS